MADPGRPRHYEEEFKRRIVQLYENGKPAREIRTECDISRSTLHRWVRGPQQRFDQGGRQPHAGAERADRVFCQVGVGRFGVSFSPCERRVSGRFGVGRSCWLLVIALVIA